MGGFDTDRDILAGGSGDDVLRGDARDELTGGPGSDTFDFDVLRFVDWAPIVVLDFQPGPEGPNDPDPDQDTVDVADLFFLLQNRYGDEFGFGNDPFELGYMRLATDPEGTMLQVRVDEPNLDLADQFIDYALFQGTDIADIDPATHFVFV